MAYDSVVAGPGKAFAFDDDFPRSKMVFGPEGQHKHVDTDSPLPVAFSGGLTIGNFPASFQVSNFPSTWAIAANSLPLPTGAATAAFQTTGNNSLATIANNTSDGLTTSAFQARIPTLGPKAASGSVSVTPSTDQDPVFDHANAVVASVTTSSTTAITLAASCKYVWAHAIGDCYIRTDGAAASTTAAGSILLLAGQPQIIPVLGGTTVTVVAGSATTLRLTPMKAR